MFIICVCVNYELGLRNIYDIIVYRYHNMRIYSISFHNLAIVMSLGHMLSCPDFKYR